MILTRTKENSPSRKQISSRFSAPQGKGPSLITKFLGYNKNIETGHIKIGHGRHYLIYERRINPLTYYIHYCVIIQRISKR